MTQINSCSVHACSQHLLSDTNDTVISINDHTTQRLLQHTPDAPELLPQHLPSRSEDMVKLLPPSHPSSDSEFSPRKVPIAKRSYQRLPHLQLPSASVRSSDKTSQKALEPTSSPESPTSTSTIETLTSTYSTPETPVSLSSPIVGVVDLTRNITTTSSGPVSHGGCSDIYQGELELTAPDGGAKEKNKIQVCTGLPGFTSQ